MAKSLWNMVPERLRPERENRPKETPGAGSEAERFACAYLRERGLRLIDRNYRCAGGEIDLVMGDSEYIVFVEVRFRRSARFGSAEETVDERKQRKLIAAALHYLQTHPQAARAPSRFDVIALSPQDKPGNRAGDRPYRVNWIQDAFRSA